jgi:hypothetical protein
MTLGAELREALDAAGRLAAAARGLGWLGALPLAAAGAWLLLRGARRRRPIAAAGGAAVGALAAVAAGGWLSARTGIGRPVLAAVAAAAIGAGAAAAPPLFAFAAGALPGALAGWHVPLGGSAPAGAAAGALAGGAVALLLAPHVAAAVSSTLGAALLVGAGLAAGGARPFAAELAGRPAVLLGAVVVLAVAGAAFQSGRAWEAPGRRPPPEVADVDLTRHA